jgi:hypothetical protein
VLSATSYLSGQTGCTPINHTVFVAAQYLCWTQIVHRDIQYIDTAENTKTQGLINLQYNISKTWGSDKIQSSLFRLFSGEQEQVGETLQQLNKKDKWECMGYD